MGIPVSANTNISSSGWYTRIKNSIFSAEEPKLTWADKNPGMFDGPWAERYPLETRLFKEFLSSVPENFKANENSWAYVFAGFENEIQSRLELNAITSFAHTQQALSGLRGVDPSSWVDRIMGANDAKDAADLVKESKEYLEIMGNGGRPQFFNRATYERMFGKPPHPWRDYGDGWRTPGLPVQDKKDEN